jgi:hypothetical protein
MAPMVHGLEAEYFGKIKFSFLDADDPRTDAFQKTLGFNYQPEFYLLDEKGNIIIKMIGFVSEDKFRNTFEQYLQ